MRLKKAWTPVSGVRVNLACGLDYREGWVNIDKYAPRVDQRWDLFKLPWPLKSDSVDWMFIEQFLEHVPPRLGDEDGLLRTLQEIHRVLKPGGRVWIGVPYAGSPSDFLDVTHYRRFIDRSFDFLDPVLRAKLPNLANHAGVEFRLLKRTIRRRVRLTRFFDTSYHLPKYLKFNPNVGRRDGLSFVLEKLPPTPRRGPRVPTDFSTPRN